MPKSYVYKLTNKINKKVYIGKSDDPKERILEHFRIARGETKSAIDKQYVIHYAIRKWGVHNFTSEIIEECSSSKIALIREEFWVDKYNSTDRRFGYNIIRGGIGAIRESKYTKHQIKRIIDKLIEKNYVDFRIFKNNYTVPYTDEFKDLILYLRRYKKIILLKDVASFFNITNRSIAKIIQSYKNGILTEMEKHINRSNSLRGKKWSEQHKQNISKVLIGKIKHTEEMKEKLSQDRMGSGNPMYGKSPSAISREKMSNFQSSRKRKPLTNEHKKILSESAKTQNSNFRIPKEIKNEIIELYSTGNYVKRELAEKFNIKLNTIIKILRNK